MKPSLAAFQAAFGRALFDTEAKLPLSTQPGFDVYRNTSTSGCIAALEANFPSVARLVGADWFRAAAGCYLQAAPPDDGRLLHYGRGFPDFLAAFAPAASLPYLAGVARLDRLWIECHVAADATPVDPARLSALSPDALGVMRLAPHPAARWRWFEGLPVFSIWSCQRAGSPIADELAWRGEGALLTRPAEAVGWRAIDLAGIAFLDACHAGATLAEAAEASCAVQARVDIASLLATLLSAGALIESTP